MNLTGICGQTNASISATLTGPLRNTVSGHLSQSLSSRGDLVPLATLKWHKDNDNVMTYLTGDIPVGDYDQRRIANLGLGHGAVDSGIGYTYFDAKNGREFSAVTGLTYNFINPDTDYQNGVDWHLDWGLSQFVTKELQLGAVGYVYQQVSGDSGSGSRLGSFESRVLGVGPQIGVMAPTKDFQTYINLKGYWEFDHENRPEGWNLWLTLSFAPAEQKTSLKE